MTLFKKSIFLFFVLPLVCLGKDELFAQGRVDAQGRSLVLDTLNVHFKIERPAFAPVESIHWTDKDPIDTLPTVNEFVKVILNADNTWRYLKLPEPGRDTTLFAKNWDTYSMDPYKKKLDDLSYTWSIWLVDSLSQYHCPYQGKLHPRGKFGVRRGRRHQGVDIPLPSGTPIYATFTGKVRVSRYSNGYGNLVVIRHENGLETFYAHLSKRMVESGDWVNAGDIIGQGGSTGRSTGPHLHFETRYDGFAFDPCWLIDFSTGRLRKRLFVLHKKFFSPYSNYEQDFEDEWKNAEEDAKEDAERKAMKWYTVKSGDTLSRIAVKNGTTVSTICRLNGIKANSTLRVGKTLRVR